MNRVAFLLMTSLAAGAAGSGLAAAPSQLLAHLNLSVQKRAVSHDVWGREVVSWRPLTVGGFHRGDVLRYTLVGATPSGPSGRTLTQPIPVGTMFVPHSATGGAVVTYSVDDGHTFDAAPTMRVPGPGGVFRTVPAPAAAYTDVRWTLPSAAGACGPVRLTYEVTVG